MLNRIIPVTQGTEEWLDLRKGLPTASRFGDFMTKGGEYSLSDTSKAYRYKIAAELILNHYIDEKRFDSPWMKHGRKYESEAAYRLAEKMKTDLLPGGFCNNRLAGCSPDRIVAGKDEIVEIKCPAPWTHCQYMAEGLEDKYEIQVQAQLWLTNADACHFWSYWPDYETLPPVYTVRKPNRLFFNKIEKILALLWADIREAEKRIIEAGGVPVVEPNR